MGLIVKSNNLTTDFINKIVYNKCKKIQSKTLEIYFKLHMKSEKRRLEDQNKIIQLIEKEDLEKIKQLIPDKNKCDQLINKIGELVSLNIFIYRVAGAWLDGFTPEYENEDRLIAFLNSDILI